MIYAATGIKELDEELERMYGAKIIYYRQALMEPEIGKDGDIAIISPRLQGEDRDLIQVIYTVRKKNVRVILLTGGDEELAAKCVAFGVYDILGDSSVDLYELKEVIDNPRRFGDLDVEPQVAFRKADARPQDERQDMLGRLKSKIFSRPAKPEKKNRTKTKKSTFQLKNLFRRSREEPVEVKWMPSGEQDALTGLLKRDAVAQYPHCQAAMFCDLDGFKKVNDTYGHAVGDRVLGEFARTLKKCVRADDPVIRWGGDEFVVLFSTLEEAERTARRVKSTWENNTVARQYSVSVSIGLGEGPGPLEAAAAADREMYRVKRGGQPAAEARVAVVSQDALTEGFLNSIKGKVLFDTGPLTSQTEATWENDWRMGHQAVPLEVGGVKFYAFTDDIGDTIDEYDMKRLEDLITCHIAVSQIVINDPAGRLSRLTAKFL